MPGAVLDASHMLSHNNPEESVFLASCIDEEIDAQKAKLTCSRSQL